MSFNIQNRWKSYAPYAIPPFAAGVAIVPVFYGLMAKSELQLGNPFPRMVPKQFLKSGFEAAPVLGTQVLVQMVIEEQIAKRSQPGFSTMLVSSIAVGALSTPLLAVLNGYTMEKSILDSLKGLTFKQTGAIVMRETSFLFSIRVSGTVSRAMKEVGGDHPLIEHGSAFVTGMIGSVFGHPADTALTLWQKNRAFAISQSMRGAAPRALACGGFTVIYRWINQALKPEEGQS